MTLARCYHSFAEAAVVETHNYDDTAFAIFLVIVPDVSIGAVPSSSELSDYFPRAQTYIILNFPSNSPLRPNPLGSTGCESGVLSHSRTEGCQDPATFYVVIFRFATLDRTLELFTLLYMAERPNKVGNEGRWPFRQALPCADVYLSASHFTSCVFTTALLLHRRASPRFPHVTVLADCPGDSGLWF